MPREELDLTRIEISPLSRDVATNQFSCGATPIDRFLKNRAHKAESRFEYRTFCACREQSNVCIGYYSLQVGTGVVSELPKAHNSYLTNAKRPPEVFPAVNLAFIGVDQRFQGQKLGRYLVMDAFSKVAVVADCAGLYALTLVSYNEKSTQFYRRIGFEIYVEADQPKLLYPIQSIMDLVAEVS